MKSRHHRDVVQYMVGLSEDQKEMAFNLIYPPDWCKFDYGNSNIHIKKYL